MKLKHQMKFPFTPDHRGIHLQTRKKLRSRLEKCWKWNDTTKPKPQKKDASGKTKWRIVVYYLKVNGKTIHHRYSLQNTGYFRQTWTLSIFHHSYSCLWISSNRNPWKIHSMWKIAARTQECPGYTYVSNGRHPERSLRENMLRLHEWHYYYECKSSITNI